MLSEKNFLEFATKSYSNPRCLSIQEFLEDLARIKYVKRLLNRYIKGEDLQERLILNHLISIYNVFDIACANELLFYRCEPESWSALKAFLIFLNYLPENYRSEINVDKNVLRTLQIL